MAIKITLILVFIFLMIASIALAIFKGYKRYQLKDNLYDLRRETKYGTSEKLNEQIEESEKRLKSLLRTMILFISFAVVMLVSLILIPGNIHQVNTGEVAVVRHMGTVTGIRNPGVYWDWYFTNEYEMYDTKVISINFSKEETASYSKDNQVISFDLNIQYRIPNNEVRYVAENIGSTNALKDIIAPKMLDATKTVIGTKTAEQIIQLRETVATVIKDSLSTPFITDSDSQFITITSVNIKNIEFTPDFEAAVAAKVAEEQKRQQALIEQERQLAEAENNKQIAIKNAEAEAQSAQLRAEAEADVARIKAQADQDVAKIEADTALYAGQKNAAIALQKLASINGWTVVTTTEANGTQYNKLYKPDETLVTADELAKGVEKLIEVYKIEKWTGDVPQYQMGEGGVITIKSI